MDVDESNELDATLDASPMLVKNLLMLIPL